MGRAAVAVDPGPEVNAADMQLQIICNSGPAADLGAKQAGQAVDKVMRRSKNLRNPPWALGPDLVGLDSVCPSRPHMRAVT
jgi:hypothetical protein